ncbi:hypothetical protein GCM10009601_41720 [Streptomyces thermospinosisporus]|uniref:HTH arsR-type domain-containing protein n=1 Tax=Streptomyces thermospinosisporus TaxID=161482 RepID=A0ABN1Z256_9ACTN
MGRARARVLVLLASPMSTSQLVAVTGQGLGSVGRHLRVLLEAGLVRRWGRAGRSVLYVRTAAGDVVVQASESESGLGEGPGAGGDLNARGRPSRAARGADTP